MALCHRPEGALQLAFPLGRFDAVAPAASNLSQVWPKHLLFGTRARARVCVCVCVCVFVCACVRACAHSWYKMNPVALYLSLNHLRWKYSLQVIEPPRAPAGAGGGAAAASRVPCAREAGRPLRHTRDPPKGVLRC